MNRVVVLAEWQRAMQSVQAAELLSQAGFAEDAVSRAYYAILHAAKAALLAHEVETKSHAGVRRMFGQHLVLTGHIESEWARYLAGSSDDRLIADYDVGMSFTASESKLECQRARDFVQRIRRHLLAKGLNERELETGPPPGQA